MLLPAVRVLRSLQLYPRPSVPLQPLRRSVLLYQPLRLSRRLKQRQAAHPMRQQKAKQAPQPRLPVFPLPNVQLKPWLHSKKLQLQLLKHQQGLHRSVTKELQGQGLPVARILAHAVRQGREPDQVPARALPILRRVSSRRIKARVQRFDEA